MKIRHLGLENVTVFDKIEIAFDEGINIFIGENGTRARSAGRRG